MLIVCSYKQQPLSTVGIPTNKIADSKIKASFETDGYRNHHTHS